MEAFIAYEELEEDGARLPIFNCMNCGKNDDAVKKEYRCWNRSDPDNAVPIDHYVCATCRHSERFCPVKLLDGARCNASCRLRLPHEVKADEAKELLTGKRHRGRKRGDPELPATHKKHRKADQDMSKYTLGRHCVECNEFCKYQDMIKHLLVFHNVNISICESLCFAEDDTFAKVFYLKRMSIK